MNWSEADYLPCGFTREELRTMQHALDLASVHCGPNLDQAIDDLKMRVRLIRASFGVNNGPND